MYTTGQTIYIYGPVFFSFYFKVDTQEEAIKTLTSAKERIEKEKYKLGKF